MIEYDPVVGIEDFIESVSGPNPYNTLDKDISEEIDKRGERVVTEIETVGNPLLASAVTHAVTKSNPASFMAGVLADGHRAGVDNPRVQRLEKIQAEQKGQGSIPIEFLGAQIPVGDFGRAFNKNALQAALGTGEILNEISPATIAERAAEQRFNPNNLPINPETGMPMARPLPGITGIKPMPKKAPMPTVQELLQSGLM